LDISNGSDEGELDLLKIQEKNTKRPFVALDCGTTPRIPIKVTATNIVVRPPHAMFLLPNLSTEAATIKMITNWIPLVMQVTANGSAIPAVWKKYAA
jgi:hypothetical protein